MENIENKEVESISASEDGEDGELFDLDSDVPDVAEMFFKHGVDLHTNTMYIGSSTQLDDGTENGVDCWFTENAIKGLYLMSRIREPITIMLNNPGGSVVEGMAVYDFIKRIKNKVTIIGMGKVYSMAGYIMQAADVRLMQKHSLFMLHEGIYDIYPDHPKQVERWLNVDKRWDKILFDMYYSKIIKKKPDFTEQQLRDMLLFDTILTADDALEHGLIDGIAE